MSAAKKLPKESMEPTDSNEEASFDDLEFDVDDDWRKEKTGTHTNIFKEEDLIDSSEEELDTGGLSLDTGGSFAKESAKNHAAEQLKKSRLARRAGKSETLEQIQAAVDGESNGEADEMEILTEEDNNLVNDPIFSNKDDLYPQIHGNYFLLDHLVDGGMAKVCRARYLGEGDEADKMVAIKMVQEKFSNDDDFVQMFIDEIKVSFGLNHPNINTTFDYGKIGKKLFVSMEYIHGKDLMDLIDDLKASGKTIPIPMAIYITSKMCEALHYAHNFTNQLTGQKYNIVHRDISPHNVMVSYEGYVKVIDFGIAKADTNSTEEAEGTIKGKINYFAPEYLEGKKIDHRYDQFAVALTLWEMLTGDKTFKGSGQIETLKTILACKPTKASIHNQDVSPALDELIMKALSRDPAYRYKDMLGFNKELMKLLYQDYPDFHESDIADLMKDLFKSSYELDLSKFKEFGQYSISDIVEKIQAYKEFQKRQAQKVSDKKGRDSEASFDFGFEEESISAKSKKGLASLVRKKKSKKEGKKESFSKGESHRQKALASLLVDPSGEDEDQHKVSFGIPWIKIGLLGLVVLAYTKREVFFSQKKPNKEQVSIPMNKNKQKPAAAAVSTAVPTAVPVQEVEMTTEQLKAQMQALIERKKEEARQRMELELKKAERLEQAGGPNQKATPTAVVDQVAPSEQASAEVKNRKEQPDSQAINATPKPVVKKIELSDEDKRELSKSEKELADLKEKMNALIKKNNFAASALSSEDLSKKSQKKEDGRPDSVAVGSEVDNSDVLAKEEQERLKSLMASKLDELEEEPVIVPKPPEGLSDKFIDFIKTRKGFSWMFSD